METYKEIIFDAPCPICGTKNRKRHGIFCDDCRTKKVLDAINEPGLDIDKLIKESINQYYEEERRKHETQSN